MRTPTISIVPCYPGKFHEPFCWIGLPWRWTKESYSACPDRSWLRGTETSSARAKRIAEFICWAGTKKNTHSRLYTLHFQIPESKKFQILPHQEEVLSFQMATKKLRRLTREILYISRWQLRLARFITFPTLLPSQRPMEVDHHKPCNRSIQMKNEKNWTSWWFQPIWKILVKLDQFPK